MLTDTLLIEIGTEELPPKSLNQLRLSLAALMRKQLEDAELSYASLCCHATPRRLALIVEELSSQQAERHIERRGPATKAAYDDEGKPSKALIGFMRSCGIEQPKQLDTLKNDKGEWLVYRADQKGAHLSVLLTEILESALAGLHIERRMRWGNTRKEFVRPVKWIVSLYGSDEMPISLFGLDSTRESRGHRFMSVGEFELTSADVYVESCLKHYVKVDFEDRRQDIRLSVEEIAAAQNAEVELDPELLDEVTSLVEWPVALKGSFDESYLSIPNEILISAMKEHQRYFHLTSNGSLLPTFIAIANIESSNPAVLVSGNERVIKPRLSDAAFFYSKDSTTSLEHKLKRLGSVVFQSQLGTYGEKSNRIAELALYLAQQLNLDSKTAERAALLAKADLVSDLVGEFPELQGIMGGYFAKNDGESNEVAKGIAQHYRPEQSGSALPEGPIASVVALADKIDTLTGLFGINEPPTGSRDPFALRRQALGVIRICIENSVSVDIVDCFHKSEAIYGKGFKIDTTLEYIFDRLYGYYSDRGISKDVVEAAISKPVKDGNLVTLDATIRALHEFQASPTAESIVAANKRVKNLLKKVDVKILPSTFDKRIATDSTEKELHLCIQKLDFGSISSLGDKFEALATLQRPINSFFDQVMVMEDDTKIRNNRLALLRELEAKFLELADFSLLK